MESHELSRHQVSRNKFWFVHLNLSLHNLSPSHMYFTLKEASGVHKNVSSKLSGASRRLADGNKISADSFALAVNHKMRRNESVYIGIKSTSLSLLALSCKSLQTGLAPRVEI